MNFYICNSIEELNFKDKNIELGDDLLEFLDENKDDFGLKNFLLQNIDPYGDTVIKVTELQAWLEMFEIIALSDILKEYDDTEEAKNVTKVVDMIKQAIERESNIVLIGD